MIRDGKKRQDKTSSTLCRLISCCVCPLFDVLSRSLVRRCVGRMKDSGGGKHKGGGGQDSGGGKDRIGKEKT
jgi:hypothetical protein